MNLNSYSTSKFECVCDCPGFDSQPNCISKLRWVYCSFHSPTSLTTFGESILFCIFSFMVHSFSVDVCLFLYQIQWALKRQLLSLFSLEFIVLIISAVFRDCTLFSWNVGSQTLGCSEVALTMLGETMQYWQEHKAHAPALWALNFIQEFYVL